MPLDDWLNKTCNLLAQYEGDDDQDAAGGALRGPYRVVQTGLACLVREKGGAPVRLEGKATSRNYHRVYFDPEDLAGITVTIKNRIELLGPNGRDAVRAFVVESTQDFNTMGRLLAVDCSEQPV